MMDWVTARGKIGMAMNLLTMRRMTWTVKAREYQTSFASQPVALCTSSGLMKEYGSNGLGSAGDGK